MTAASTARSDDRTKTESAAKETNAEGAKAPPVRKGAARQILDATARLLRYHGYEATTTRAIAQEVGLKAGSIYHHFPSKDVIVETVVIEGVQIIVDAVVAALAALPADANPRIRVGTAVRTHLLSSLEHSDYTSASIRAFAFLPEHIRAQCSKVRSKYEDIWRLLVGDAHQAHCIAADVSPDAVRLLLLGALNWAGEWYQPNGLSIDKIAHDFTASILREGRNPDTAKPRM
jgi:TetR/AcrR family transcriptional regulator, cholesterol catabolism regulator